MMRLYPLCGTGKGNAYINDILAIGASFYKIIENYRGV